MSEPKPGPVKAVYPPSGSMNVLPPRPGSDKMQMFFEEEESSGQRYRRLRREARLPTSSTANLASDEALEALRRKLTEGAEPVKSWLDKEIDRVQQAIHTTAGQYVASKFDRRLFYEFADAVVGRDRVDDLDQSRRARNIHGELAMCHCGEAVEWDEDIQKWWIPYQYGNPLPNTFDCPATGAGHTRKKG